MLGQYPAGPPGSMQYWPLRVTRLIDHAAREFPQRPVVSLMGDGSIERVDWGGIAHNARRMAQALIALGAGKGDRIATLANNHGRHLTAWYGAIGMSGVLHTLNPKLHPDQLDYIANHARDTVLIYDHAYADLVAQMKPRWPTIRHYICFDPPAGWDGDAAFADWLTPHDGQFDWVMGDERDPCALCYTSGTTGDPKGVLYEHRTTLLHAMAEVAPDSFNLSLRDTLLPLVPLYHANAWGLPWAAPLTGCKMVLSALFDPARIVRLMHDEGVTHSGAVPTIWQALIDHLRASGDTLGRVRHITIGGTAAPRDMIRFFLDRGVELHHAWGMTELSPIGSHGSPGEDWDLIDPAERIARCLRQGRAAFGIELRVVDDEGQPLPRDGVSAGELQARGAWVVDRYEGDSDRATTADGWFPTGDVAIYHPDGSVELTDRIKDVIKSGGEWISSVRLEQAVMECPGVTAAAAIALPDVKWDERPLLLVVRSDQRLTADTIRLFLNGKVPKWWIPQAIEFVEELPLTGTGKVSKRTLRDQYRQTRMTAAR